ncbi:hypothetical protein [Phormidium tenue]|uniref:hypothetical protein n=1 Tax=Phormidium tenue TaxID=126344 RepID=UPI0018EFE0B1|nr:hypothetical protein [Phormidium tenue]
MFRKQPPPEPAKSGKPDQSQSLSNVTLNGSIVEMGQAGRDQQISQTGDLKTQQQGLTGADVVTLLEKLETAVKGAAIDPALQEELLFLMGGGIACFQHVCLRFVLWQSGTAPWDLAQFLNYCVERRLLQRVGDRYRFLHRELLDHFAQLQPLNSPPA